MLKVLEAMMKAAKKKLTLDQPATYQIKVSGLLDESWSEWAGGMTITIENGDDGPPTTTLGPRIRGPTLPFLERHAHLSSHVTPK